MSRFSHKKSYKSDYFGAYPIAEGKWETRITVDGKKYTFGPFNSDREAALTYDREAIRLRTKAGPLNFPSRYMTKVIEPKSKKRKRITPPANKKRKIANNKSDKSKTIKRKSFSAQMRMKVACRQGWRCNFCTKHLDEAFIVDHMLPLMLQGSNDIDMNIQALCSACNRYKTSIFDYKVLLPISKTEKLTPQRILKLQEEKYWEMNCMTPPSVQNQFSPHDCVNESLKSTNTVLTPSNESRGITISFAGIKLSITR